MFSMAPGSTRIPLARRRIGESLVDVKPEINVKPTIPINIDLGGLPLSIGLFAASGLTFLIRGALPKGWPQTLTIIGGGGLAAAGVINLMLPKAKASAPAAPAAPPSGVKAAEERPAGFAPPSVPAFSKVQFEMITPQPDQEIEHWGWLFSTDRIPVTVRLYNPTAEPVSFNLEFEWDEMPSLVGYSRESNHGAKAFQVTLGPNEQRNDVFELPVATGGFSTSLQVAMSVYKKRTPQENRFLLMTRTFVVV